MKAIFLAVLFLLLLTNGSSYALNRDEGMESAEGFFLPQGDAAAGKKAFAALRCTGCHWAANDSTFSEGPVAGKPGPILGAKQASYSAGWLADSIISPSHTIAAGSGGQADEGELSRMGDFTEVMTVRQLIDIVEYLQSLE